MVLVAKANFWYHRELKNYLAEWKYRNHPLQMVPKRSTVISYQESIQICRISSSVLRRAGLSLGNEAYCLSSKPIAFHRSLSSSIEVCRPPPKPASFWRRLALFTGNCSLSLKPLMELHRPFCSLLTSTNAFCRLSPQLVAIYSRCCLRRNAQCYLLAMKGPLTFA